VIAFVLDRTTTYLEVVAKGKFEVHDKVHTSILCRTAERLYYLPFDILTLIPAAEVLSGIESDFERCQRW